MDPGPIVRIISKLDPGKTLDTASSEMIEKDRQQVWEEYLGLQFLLGTDLRRYGKLVEDIGNSYTAGKDIYPKKMKADYPNIKRINIRKNTIREENCVNVF